MDGAIVVSEESVKMTELFDFLIIMAKDAENAARVELPLLAQEIITYGIISNSIILFSSFVISIVSGIYIGKSFKKYKISKEEFEEKDHEYLCNHEAEKFAGWTVCCSIICFISVITAIVESVILLKIIYAPRLYLLEQVMNIIDVI